ncbi:MAG: 2-polyprenylphenol 6-hydroxylase, partial [Rhodospirillales bacterium]|nr:2-polyprenylphenol 6-hydroxylase [Rhodospirillales bacterium]
MFRSLRNLWRLFTIARVLARHDALFMLDLVSIGWLVALPLAPFRRRDPARRPGQRLAAALEELGPTFIKLGQALSVRSDLIGEPMAEDLAQLQDQLPPFPGVQARAIIEAELGHPVEAVFNAFDDTPVAAASIAQVHFAITTEGAEVAVKVLRPGVEQAFARDIDLFYWLAGLIEWSRPALRRLRPVDSVRAFEDSVTMEMDLRFEAAAAAEMSENFAGDDTFSVP